MKYDILKARSLLEQAAAELQSAPWFKPDWIVKVHDYPPEPAPAESVSMHVYKRGWFNETRQGIHFETHLSEKEFEKKTIPIMLHLFHTNTIPGTQIKRIKVSKPFVDATFKTISQWDGYIFRAGKYGTQPFTCTRQFTPETFAKILTIEFGRMCTILGTEIDIALSSALNM